MTTGERDRARRAARGLMTTCVVMLTGIAVSEIAGPGTVAFSFAELRAEPQGCAVNQVHLTPSLLYSAEARGYVVSAITFDQIPPGCLGQRYHLAFVAADGAQVFEVTGEIDDEHHQVVVPAGEQPRADVVATTVLSMLPERGVLHDSLAWRSDEGVARARDLGRAGGRGGAGRHRGPAGASERAERDGQGATAAVRATAGRAG